MKLRKRKKKILASASCKARGHNYNNTEFVSYCLYFCTRCRREMFNRTFDDIEPMTEEEVDLMHRFTESKDL